eukprot:scaffold3164_cov112-Isochrysis_galbana.AAC.6
MLLLLASDLAVGPNSMTPCPPRSPPTATVISPDLQPSSRTAASFSPTCASPATSSPVKTRRRPARSR